MHHFAPLQGSTKQILPVNIFPSPHPITPRTPNLPLSWGLETTLNFYTQCQTKSTQKPNPLTHTSLHGLILLGENPWRSWLLPFSAGKIITGNWTVKESYTFTFFFNCLPYFCRVVSTSISAGMSHGAGQFLKWKTLALFQLTSRLHDMMYFTFKN